jgi:hypothetical protein
MVLTKVSSCTHNGFWNLGTKIGGKCGKNGKNGGK